MAKIVDLYENEQACLEVTLRDDNTVTVYYCGDIVEECTPKYCWLAKNAFRLTVAAIAHDPYCYICDVEHRRLQGE